MPSYLGMANLHHVWNPYFVPHKLCICYTHAHTGTHLANFYKGTCKFSVNKDCKSIEFDRFIHTQPFCKVIHTYCKTGYFRVFCIWKKFEKIIKSEHKSALIRMQRCPDHAYTQNEWVCFARRFTQSNWAVYVYTLVFTFTLLTQAIPERDCPKLNCILLLVIKY